MADESAAVTQPHTSSKAGDSDQTATLGLAGEPARPTSPRPLPAPDHAADSSSLHAGLRGDVDKLNMVNAVVAIVAGVLLLAFPGAFRWLFQLGGATDPGLRLVGAAWVLIGLWFAATAARPRSRLVATVSALLLIVNAAAMLALPFIRGLDVGWFGWLALFGLALYSGTSAAAWLLVRNRMAGRVKPRPSALREEGESESHPAGESGPPPAS